MVSQAAADTAEAEALATIAEAEFNNRCEYDIDGFCSSHGDCNNHCWMMTRDR
jgi:hypothetical protein